MNYLYSIAMVIIASVPGALAQQSNLLDNVKRNPEEAQALCSQFRNLNTKGISAGSKATINQISEERNLSFSDSEILSIYVIGLYCPEVK